MTVDKKRKNSRRNSRKSKDNCDRTKKVKGGENCESAFKNPRNKIEAVDRDGRNRDKGLIMGRNPIKEVMNSDDTVEKILVIKNGEGSIRQLVARAKEKSIDVLYCDKKTLDRISDGENHQGIVAYVTDFKYSTVDDILKEARDRHEKPFVVILDGITDPHNLGAVIRTAECAGVHGIIIPKRRAVSVTPTVVKTSAGATSYMRVAKVTNIASTIEELKKEGLWIYSCNMGGENYKSLKYDGGVGLVIGNEGDGVSCNVQSKCDFTVSIPMKGKISSLNASNAAAIIMYEVTAQRGVQ